MPGAVARDLAVAVVLVAVEGNGALAAAVGTSAAVVVGSGGVALPFLLFDDLLRVISS